MIAVFGWGIAIIELVIIFVLLKAVRTVEDEKRAMLKWIAKREILRKFHEDR